LTSSCRPRAAATGNVRNTPRKPREFLEYVVAHEMAHLVEPTHNARFIALMDRLVPHWKTFRNELNRLPVSHENWSR
jgi:predicted metal-dependent hydrolase